MNTPVQKPLYNKATQSYVDVKALDLDVLVSRVHELALQRWLNANFVVQAGYPVPVIFSTPMDAFAEFGKLWQNADQPNNPFNYLMGLKDKNGQPIYEPYPSNVRYPLISVKRTGWNFRPTMSYGTHRFRTQGWPSVADITQGLTKQDLSYVQSSRMPTAWNFRFQIDHWGLRPDTQARFVHAWIKSMAHTGGQPQVWIRAVYPNWQGPQTIRMYMDGDITDATEEPGPDMPMVYHTSVSVVIEGYFPDIDTVYTPALWSMVIGNSTAISADSLASFYDIAESGTIAYDLRVTGTNPVFDTRPDLPPWAPVPVTITDSGTSPTPQGRITDGILP